MSRYELVKEMVKRVGLAKWYAMKLLTNVITFEARTGKRVSNESLAHAVKYMSDNRQYLVAPPY